jgi:hypothetical protein
MPNANNCLPRWWTAIQDSKFDKENLPPKRQQRFEPRMQMDYSIGLMMLHEQALNPPLPIKKWPESKPKPTIEVMSICKMRIVVNRENFISGWRTQQSRPQLKKFRLYSDD